MRTAHNARNGTGDISLHETFWFQLPRQDGEEVNMGLIGVSAKLALTRSWRTNCFVPAANRYPVYMFRRV